MCNTGFGCVHPGTAQLLLVHDLSGHGFDNCWAGQEHITGFLHHQGEVGQGGGIHGTAGAGAHNHADLRHHAAGEYIALENLAVAGKGIYAFLDPGAAGIVQSDHGSTGAHSHIHHLAYLFRHRLAQGAAVDREVLGKHEHKPSVYCALSGHDSVAVGVRSIHSEVGASVLDEHVELFETAGIQQKGETLARRQLALRVLGVDTFLPATEPGFFAPFDQFFDLFLLNIHINKNVNSFNNYVLSINYKRITYALAFFSKKRSATTAKRLILAFLSLFHW